MRNNQCLHYMNKRRICLKKNSLQVLCITCTVFIKRNLPVRSAVPRKDFASHAFTGLQAVIKFMCLWKPLRYCATSPLQTKLLKTQTQFQKICKQSCTQFWKLVYEPSALQKCSTFSKQILWFLEKAFPICGAAAPLMHVQYMFQILAYFFGCVLYVRQCQ